MPDAKAVMRKVDMLPAPMVQLVRSLVPDCGALLPQDISPDQFRAGLWLELTGRPQLNGCSLDSLRTCIVQAANDGMLPGRDTHFLPFRVKGQFKATKVDNYHGLQRALERTGKVIRSWAAPVCEGDTWEFDRFMDRPRHVEAMTMGKAPGRELFYYGAILFKDQTCAFEPISMEDLKAIELCSPSHETGPWKEWPQMMRRKSALKRVCKYVPLTPQLERILAEDDARLETDMRPERHQKNLTDLFDNNPSASTQHNRAEVVDIETGEIQGSDSEPQEDERNLEASSGLKTEKPQIGWRGVIERYLIDSDTLKGVIPPAFYAECLAAFDAPSYDAQAGVKLAGQLQEWLDSEGGA